MISINTWLVSAYKPTLKYSYSVLKKHFQYSFPVLGTKSFNYWTRNADNFFIGSFLGSEALGYYSRAFFFVAMPTQKISSIIGNVLFPSLSMIKEDKVKVSELYLKAMRMTSFITFPLLGGLIVFAEPFTYAVFGVQWLPMVLTLQILCVLSLFKSVFDFTTSIFYSQGATKLNFKISLIYGIFNIVVFYIGAQYSIEMVAYLLVLFYFIFLIPKIYYSSGLINLKFVKVFQSIWNVFFINLLCILVCYLFSPFFIERIKVISFLILGGLFYVLLFIFVNVIFNKAQLNEFVTQLLKVNKA
jgi:PST family polysaccharide transporter